MKYYDFEETEGEESKVVVLHVNDDLEEGDLEQLKHFSNLNELRLSHCELHELELPGFLYNRLLSLELQGNRFRYIPSSFGKFKQLAKLDLSANQLKALPAFAFDISGMRSLFLDRNEIKSIEKIEKGKTFYLQAISVSNNQISKIGEDFAGFQELKTLLLSHNEMNEFSPGLCPSLQFLDLSHNHLSNLNPLIRSLPKLRHANLAKNKIGEIPEQIEELEQLAELYLSGNPLNRFPTPLLKLTSLTKLNLTACPIGAVPSEIRLLANLQELSFAQTGITSLPDEILELEQLKTLKLNGCEIENLHELIQAKPSFSEVIQ